MPCWKLFTILLSAFLLACLLADGQTESMRWRSNVRVSPLKLLDISNPGLEASLERHVSSRWSGQLTVALLADPFCLWEYREFHGYRLLTSGKYFFSSLGHKERVYLSPELGFARVGYQTRGGFYSAGDTAAYGIPLNVIRSSFDVDKRLLYFNARLGCQATFGRIVGDFSLGLGVKRKVTTRSAKAFPDYVMVRPRHPNVFYQTDKEADGFFFNLPANISVGYTF